MRPLRSIVLAVLLCATAGAQEVQRFILKDFLGMDTRSGDFSIDPRACRYARDVDFSAYVGSIAKRKGYVVVDTLAGKTFRSLYAAYYDDGTQRLFYVAEDDTLYRGAIYRTAPGSDSVSIAYQVYGDFYAGSDVKVTWTQYRNYVFVANGKQKGVVVVDSTALPFPLDAPGEPTVVPLSKPGPLKGEYRYVIVATTPAHTADATNGYITSSVIVDSGQVLLKNFQWLPGDSLHAGDSVAIAIYRTKANVGIIDQGDSIYYVTTLPSSGNYFTNPAVLDTLTFIDSTADGALSPATKKPLIDDVFIGRDSTGTINGIRYGAPMFVSSDTGGFIYRGSNIDTSTIIGVAYTVSFITDGGFKSDTGRSLIILRDQAHTENSYTIALPYAPPNLGVVAAEIWRAPVLRISYDTAANTQWLYCGRDYRGWDCFWTDDFRGYTYDNYHLTDWKTTYLVADSLYVGAFYRIATVDVNDSLEVQFADSVSFDSLFLHEPKYRRTVPPSLPTRFAVFGDKLVAATRSMVRYMSDSLQSWGAWQVIPIAPHDGDEITAIFPSRTALRVMKHRSNYNVYGNLQSSELVGRWGCVAPLSVSSGIDGTFYLSDRGVVLESEGQFLERTVTTGLISRQLVEFDNMSASVKNVAFGLYIPTFDQYWLSVNNRTYVYHGLPSKQFGVPVWSLYMLNIGGATLYSTESSPDFLVGDTLYFFIRDGHELCKFGASEYDDGRLISLQWKSAPLLVGSEYKDMISLGVWSNASSASDSAYFVFYDESDSNITDGLIIKAAIQPRYRTLDTRTSPARYFTLAITNDLFGTSFAGVRIDALEFYYRVVGRTQIE